MKKIKLRNKKKHFDIRHILLIFIVFMISISVGYSKFSTHLQILANVSR